MEENKENKIIQNILSQASEIKAPYDMSERVLSAWKTQSSKTQTYGPLIPVWFWFVLGVFFVGMIGWVFSSASITSGPSITQSLLNKGVEYLQLDLLSLNPVMITALGVFGIMLFINSFLLNIQYHHLKA